MKTKEQLRKDIKDLMLALVENNWNLKRMQRINNTREQCNLLCVRAEIYKSIAHRQGLLIQALDIEVEYGQKEAA